MWDFNPAFDLSDPWAQRAMHLGPHRVSRSDGSAGRRAVRRSQVLLLQRHPRESAGDKARRGGLKSLGVLFGSIAEGRNGDDMR